MKGNDETAEVRIVSFCRNGLLFILEFKNLALKINLHGYFYSSFLFESSIPSKNERAIKSKSSERSGLSLDLAE
jgi:hypothetical protein